jgi:hypothetical protein
LFIDLGRARALSHFDAWDESEIHCQKAADTLRNDRSAVFAKSSLPALHFAFDSAFALVNARQGRLDKSLGFVQKMIATANESPSAVDVNSGFTLAKLAQCYIGEGHLDAAERILELAYCNCRKFPLHPDSDRVQSVYAQLLEATDRHDEIPDMRKWIRPVPDRLASLQVASAAQGHAD